MSLPSDLPLQFLRYFVLIAETGSYRTTAEKAHRSQPAVSLAIKQLEGLLGQPLFEPAERTRLTAFGEACLPVARDFLRYQAQTFDRLLQLVNNEVGSVTLACVPTAATHLIPAVLPQLLSAYPGVDVTLLDDNSRGVERMVLAEEADFGICSHFVEDGRLTAQPLMQDEYGLVMPAAHPLARRRSLTWAEVAALPLLGSAAHHQLQYYSQAPTLPKPRVFISNMISLLSLLEEGVGVAVLARLAIPPHYREQLRFVPIASPRIERSLVLLSLAKRSLAAPARHLIDLIRAKIDAGEYGMGHAAKTARPRDAKVPRPGAGQGEP